MAKFDAKARAAARLAYMRSLGNAAPSVPVIKSTGKTIGVELCPNEAFFKDTSTEYKDLFTGGCGSFHLQCMADSVNYIRKNCGACQREYSALRRGEVDAIILEYDAQFLGCLDKLNMHAVNSYRSKGGMASENIVEGVNQKMIRLMTDGYNNTDRPNIYNALIRERNQTLPPLLNKGKILGS